MTAKRVTREMTLVFKEKDDIAAKKRTITDAVTILNAGGYELCGVVIQYHDVLKKKAVPEQAPAPKVRRPRKLKAASPSPFDSMPEDAQNEHIGN
jgi:hypothetical protein